MNLTVYEPWKLLQSVREELNRAFGGALSGFDDETRVATSLWSPAVDIREEPERYVLFADVPGVDPQDIKVTMDNGVLTIQGERKLPSGEAREQYRRTERLYGTFIRRFALPDGVDAERVEATCRNGVLTVIVPRAEQARPRQIEVKAAA